MFHNNYVLPTFIPRFTELFKPVLTRQLIQPHQKPSEKRRKFSLNPWAGGGRERAACGSMTHAARVLASTQIFAPAEGGPAGGVVVPLMQQSKMATTLQHTQRPTLGTGPRSPPWWWWWWWCSPPSATRGTATCAWQRENRRVSLKKGRSNKIDAIAAGKNNWPARRRGIYRTSRVYLCVYL